LQLDSGMTFCLSFRRRLARLAKDGSQSVHYSIWAADNVVYGRELPTLVAWVKDERVLADTWVFEGHNDRWRKAAQLAELQMFFQKKALPPPPRPGETGRHNVTPGMLRRVKALAEMTDSQLERFVQYMEPQDARQWSQIVKQTKWTTDVSGFGGRTAGAADDQRKETILATLGRGVFWRDGLFDRGRARRMCWPTRQPPAQSERRSIRQTPGGSPELAVPMLHAISRTLAPHPRRQQAHQGQCELRARRRVLERIPPAGRDSSSRNSIFHRQARLVEP